ncbi:MAG: hypothetical protein M1383_02805 [Patescibacteria group bacterium]|nr:hypothetical protein [Patescibacteria group bacterium]
MEHQTLWMVISGITGFSFFLIANFTRFFAGSSVTAGVLQVGVNAFVFAVWREAFLASAGFWKFVAFWGVAIPLVMASVTLCRVLLPAMLKLFRR